MHRVYLLCVFLTGSIKVSGQLPGKNFPPQNPQFDFVARSRPSLVLLTPGRRSCPYPNHYLAHRYHDRTGLCRNGTSKLAPHRVFKKNAVRYEAETRSLINDFCVATDHKVTFRNLLPGTSYTYRVGPGSFWSEWISFEAIIFYPSW